MFAIAMAQSCPHIQLNTFHASPYPVPGLPSDPADAVTLSSHDYPTDTTRDAHDPSFSPYTCSRPYSHNYKDIEEDFDSRMAITLGPSPSLSSVHRQSLDSSARTLPPTVARVKRNQLVLGTGALSVTTQQLAPDEPPSAVSALTANSGGSELWSPVAVECAPNPPRPKKRREKPHIELAPDQPPTTQGKPRARVYVACIQCRMRKIRCDGAKPVCHNCGRRTMGNNECSYDSMPKRRGPDKTPGARQRLARDVRNQLELLPGRRRRRTRDVPPSETNDTTNYNSSLSPPRDSAGAALLPIPVTVPPAPGASISYNVCSPVGVDAHSVYPCECHGLSHCPELLGTVAFIDGREPHHMDSQYTRETNLSSTMVYGTSPMASRSYIAELDENGDEKSGDHSDMVDQPSLSFARDIWWESLLLLYMSPVSTRLRSFSPAQRDSAAQGVASDLRFVFRASNYWFSFFHIPTFFGNFFDPLRRKQMQPSLVLALLAMSTFWQSSEVGLGLAGRERAFRFRDEAQSALEASVNAGWLDETLAQAAWILALFEVCAHPRHSSERCVSALVMLDSIIRSLSLTLLDADDPDATMFLPGTVPVVPVRDQQRTGWFGYQPLTSSHQVTQNPDLSYNSIPSPVDHRHPPQVGCSCTSLTLGEHWSLTNEHTPMWASTPAWNNSWTEGEIRKESIRRLCWSAMVVAAGHISYTTAHRSHNPDLFVAEPANYALLFSGESIARSPTLSMSSKDTVWALQDRCFLLWHACIRMRTDRTASDGDKAQFATRAWLEADALESALNRHTCSIERAFIFQAREYIFNTRMSISYEFQRYIPLVTANVNGLFHRRKAEEWLRHQATVAERFMHGLHTITGNANNLLARRPFFVFWFMGQISRSLSLWECDNSLTVALDVCKALLPAIDYLSALWPCPEQRVRYDLLRERLANACYVAGVGLPLPPNFSLPSSSSPEALV